MNKILVDGSSIVDGIQGMLRICIPIYMLVRTLMVVMTIDVMELGFLGSKISVLVGVCTGMVLEMIILTVDGPLLTYFMCLQSLEML